MLDLKTEPRRHASPEPPPTGPARAAGGLLGVVAGATFLTTTARPTSRADDPTSTALVDLSHSYAQHPGNSSPADVAARHAGVPAPAWLLPVAITHTRTANLVGTTLRLAAKASVSGPGLAACVAYIKVAAYLLAAYPTDSAVELGTGAPAPRDDTVPPTTGQPEQDALHAAVWAVSRPGSLAEVLPVVTATSPRCASAAAAGLVGLRDGLDGIPPEWHNQIAATDRCLTLAYGLLRARAFGGPPDSA